MNLSQIYSHVDRNIGYPQLICR